MSLCKEGNLCKWIHGLGRHILISDAMRVTHAFCCFVRFADEFELVLLTFFCILFLLRFKTLMCISPVMVVALARFPFWFRTALGSSISQHPLHNLSWDVEMNLVTSQISLGMGDTFCSLKTKRKKKGWVLECRIASKVNTCLTYAKSLWYDQSLKDQTYRWGYSLGDHNVLTSSSRNIMFFPS